MVQLPNKLSQLICEPLRPSGDVKRREQDKANLTTLRSVSQANRAFRRVAHPIIFYSLDFREHDLPVSRSTLQLFLEVPHLAEFVRKLSTLSWTWEGDHSPPSDQQLQLTLVAIDGNPIFARCRELLKKGLKTGEHKNHQNTELAVLLSLCTKRRALKSSARVLYMRPW